MKIPAQNLSAGEKLYIANLVNEQNLPKEHIARHIGIAGSSVALYAQQALRVPNPFVSVVPQRPTSREAPAGMPDDPWKGQEVSLRKQKLNLEQQKYIAALINLRGIDAETVAEKFSLSIPTVCRHAKRFREGEAARVYEVASGDLKVTVGDSQRYTRHRNAIFDDLSLQVLAARASGGITRAGMKELILDEVAQTNSRRPPGKTPLEVGTRELLGQSKTVRSYIGKYGPYLE